jgi:hypothetical protein
MEIKRRYYLSAAMLVGVLAMFLTIHGLGGAISSPSIQENNSIDLPVVDYDNEVTKEKSKARKEKDSHFKGRGNPDSRKPITELPSGIEPLPTSGHWWIGLSALPVDQSDAIILGNILVREAHLSSDKTGIYSEFNVQLNQVFKDTTGTLVVGDSLPVNRAGGSVRFASGKIQKYSLAGQGMPRTGSLYVLFLRKTAEGDLVILTGYELSGGHVTPLDGENNRNPKSDLPFAKYRGANQDAFLEELRRAVVIAATGGA